jgi:hypothetical protein
MLDECLCASRESNGKTRFRLPPFADVDANRSPRVPTNGERCTGAAHTRGIGELVEAVTERARRWHVDGQATADVTARKDQRCI